MNEKMVSQVTLSEFFMYLSVPRGIVQLLCEVKSSQVSPNARTRAQSKGGGGKKKSIHQKLYNLEASLRKHESNIYMKQKSRKHEGRESRRTAFLATLSQLPKALYPQNISNLASQSCGRPREGYSGTGFHARRVN